MVQSLKLIGLALALVLLSGCALYHIIEGIHQTNEAPRPAQTNAPAQ